MQIIEITGMGVRSSVVRLRRRGTPMSFVVYPMVHMAEPEFYAAVTARLRAADVVVVEGIGGDDGGSRLSLLGRALTLTYSVLRFNRRAGRLVRQDIDYDGLDAEIVHPDVTGTEFSGSWRRAPLRERLLTWIMLPAVVLTRLFGGSRSVWTRDLEMDDLPSPRQERTTEKYSGLDGALRGDRDAMLLRALYHLHETRGTENLEVAIVYGAAHVPAIVHGLSRTYGYRPCSADWLTVAST